MFENQFTFQNKCHLNFNGLLTFFMINAMSQQQKLCELIIWKEYNYMWNVQNFLFYAANKEPTLYEKFLKNPKSVPLITSRKLENCNKYRQPRQAWLETLSTVEDHKLGMLDLHPDIFAVHPRYYSSFFSVIGILHFYANCILKCKTDLWCCLIQ